MNDDTVETAEPWLVELLVHSDPGPLVRKHLSLAKVLALSRACKSMHKLMLNETTRARNTWMDAKEEALDFGDPIQIICGYGAAETGYLSMLVYLHEIWGGYCWNARTCEKAAEQGHLDCLQYLHENGCPWDEDTCWEAARNGQLACLQYAHENGCPWEAWTCVWAATNGHLNCLQYAHEKGCPWNEWTCREAAKGGHSACLHYLRENNCPGCEMYV
tara:strand:- start:28 stop:678 length:651 start_codon:yes stop_codon:yes gene_type:complete